MALTDDQRAMLRLLAQSEEGYEDIAALKGVSVEQVKAEVRDALTAAAAEQEAESAPPEPPPPPREPSPPPPPPPAPEAAKPQPPTPPVATPRPSRSAGFSVPPERRRFLAIAGGALGVVAVALVLVAVLGGGSGGSGSSSAGNGGASEAASAENANLTQAVLRPVGGSSGKGRAIFGRVGKEEIVLQVTARELEPAQGGQSYTVWLYRSPQVALRVGAVKVGKSGRLGGQFPIPAELLAYVASGAFKQVYLSRTDDAAYRREVARAEKQKKLPPYTGETVLKGKITGPVVKGSASSGS